MIVLVVGGIRCAVAALAALAIVIAVGSLSIVNVMCLVGSTIG